MARPRKDTRDDDAAPQALELAGGPEPVPEKAPEPLISATAFIEAAALRRVQADLVRSLFRLEKHTLNGWRKRLKAELERPTGGRP